MKMMSCWDIDRIKKTFLLQVVRFYLSRSFCHSFAMRNLEKSSQISFNSINGSTDRQVIFLDINKYCNEVS